MNLESSLKIDFKHWNLIDNKMLQNRGRLKWWEFSTKGRELKLAQNGLPLRKVTFCFVRLRSLRVTVWLFTWRNHEKSHLFICTNVITESYSLTWRSAKRCVLIGLFLKFKETKFIWPACIELAIVFFTTFFGIISFTFAGPSNDVKS